MSAKAHAFLTAIRAKAMRSCVTQLQLRLLTEVVPSRLYIIQGYTSKSRVTTNIYRRATHYCTCRPVTWHTTVGAGITTANQLSGTERDTAERETETDRQTDRQTDRERQRETERQRENYRCFYSSPNSS